MFAYNTFNSPKLANYSPYELVFGRKAKLLLDQTNPDIKVAGTFKDYYMLLNKSYSIYINCSRKVAIRYIGPLVIYKIIDPYNYLLMMLDGKILRGLFEHERLK